MPGYLFAVPGRGFKVKDNTTFMRATFAGNLEEIEAALAQFGKTTKAFFKAGISADESAIISEV